MNGTVREWLDKFDGDYATARRELGELRTHGTEREALASAVRAEGLQRGAMDAFNAGSDWWNNACVNYMPPGEAATLYATGFREGADLLVDSAMESRCTRDTIIYPVVFLYRHYLELHLKLALELLRAVRGDDRPAPMTHNLGKLWRELRRELHARWPDAFARDAGKVDRCIEQFSDADPASTAFRYASKKDGTPSVAHLTHINIRKLKEVVTTAAETLEKYDNCLCIELDTLGDMASDWTP